jgi:hypothetical protein
VIVLFIGLLILFLIRYVDPEAIARAANDDGFALSFARIECHYFVNGAFMRTDNQVKISQYKYKRNSLVHADPCS